MKNYVTRGGQRGYERLQVLARSWAASTADLLDRIDVRPGQRCVDLGCGSGDVTFELARRVGPTGSVVGIDLDEVKLGLARGVAEALGFTQIEFRRADMRGWSERDAYDIVYCRNFLQHLAGPVDVLGQMWAAVRDGGALAVEDADFVGSFCDPPNDAFDFWVATYARVLALHGGDPLMGRKLFRSFLAAGIPSPRLSTVQRADVVGEAKALPWSTIEATAEAIVADGVASEQEVSEALDELARFTADPTTVIGSPRLFQCWARRA